jgi:hypothetical protein
MSNKHTELFCIVISLVEGTRLAQAKTTIILNDVVRLKPSFDHRFSRMIVQHGVVIRHPLITHDQFNPFVVKVCVLWQGRVLIISLIFNEVNADFLE